MLISVPKGIIQLLIKKEFLLLKAFLRGVFWNFQGKNIYQNEGVIYNDY
jgi:hypothetical protein